MDQRGLDQSLARRLQKSAPDNPLCNAICNTSDHPGVGSFKYHTIFMKVSTIFVKTCNHRTYYFISYLKRRPVEADIYFGLPFKLTTTKRVQFESHIHHQICSRVSHGDKPKFDQRKTILPIHKIMVKIYF